MTMRPLTGLPGVILIGEVLPRTERGMGYRPRTPRRKRGAEYRERGMEYRPRTERGMEYRP
jgi:hypothetical protein